MEEEEDKMDQEKVRIIKEKEDVFYQVEGGITQYYDLTNLKRNHPELKVYIEQHQFDLQRQFFRKKELE